MTWNDEEVLRAVEAGGDVQAVVEQQDANPKSDGEHDFRLDFAVRLHELFREKVRHEDTLIHNRLTHLLSIQAVLFGGYTIAGTPGSANLVAQSTVDFVRTYLPAVAVLACIGQSMGVFAAIRAVQVLRTKEYPALMDCEYLADVWDKVGGLRQVLASCQPHHFPRHMGHMSTYTVMFLPVFMWAVVLMQPDIQQTIVKSLVFSISAVICLLIVLFASYGVSTAAKELSTRRKLDRAPK